MKAIKKCFPQPLVTLVPFLLCVFFQFALVPRGILAFSLLVTVLLYIFVIRVLGEKVRFIVLTILFHIIIFWALFTGFRINPSSYPISDSASYNQLGTNIFQYGEYGKKINDPGISPSELGYTGRKLFPTAFRSVGYPLFVAFVYFVTQSTRYEFVLVAQMLLHLVSLILLWLLAKDKLGDRKANLVLAFYQLGTPLITSTNVFMVETLMEFLLVVGIFFFVWLLDGKKQWLSAVVSGLAGGYLILVRSFFILYTPVLLYLLLRKSRKKLLSVFLFMFLWLAPPAIMSVRNSILAGKFTFVATNGGLILFLGNNPWVSSGRAAAWPDWYYVKEAVGSDLVGVTHVDIHTNQQTKGIKEEMVFDAAFKKAGLKWIIANPLRFFHLGLSKLQHLFRSYPYTGSSLEHFNRPRGDQYNLLMVGMAFLFWVFLYFAMVGLLDKKASVVVLLALPYIGIICTFLADPRYQMPLFIPMAFIAPPGLAYFAKAVKKRNLTNIYKITIVTLIFLMQAVYFRSYLTSGFEKLLFERRKQQVSRYEVGRENIFIIDSAQEGAKSLLIVKTADEHTSGKASLMYENTLLSPEELRVLVSDATVTTSSLDLFDWLAPEFKENFYLEYLYSYKDLPVFAVKAKASLDGLTVANVITNPMVSTSVNQESLVRVLPPLKSGNIYVRMQFALRNGSEIRVKGEREVVLKSYSRYGDITKGVVYIPKKSLGSGDISIYIKNKVYPANVDMIPMDTGNTYLWDKDSVVIESVDILSSV